MRLGTGYIRDRLGDAGSARYSWDSEGSQNTKLVLFAGILKVSFGKKVEREEEVDKL